MAGGAIEHGFDLGEFGAIAIGRGDYGNGDHPWHQLERGEIEVDEYNRAVDDLARKRGHDGFPPLPVDRILGFAMNVRPEMLHLISDVRTRGISTGIVTNNVRALGAWRDLADWDSIVDLVVDSSHIGMRKPEARIFEYVCSSLWCRAGAKSVSRRHAGQRRRCCCNGDAWDSGLRASRCDR